ncbi:MAG: DUF1285 domain-containing protein [Sphingomonas sp.]|nr:DUF1285 domain-containing protein [Sphingomonas sp.]
MPESQPPIDLADQSLHDLAVRIADRSHPPVERWNPTLCGISEMRIARDGTWYHQDVAIGREAMVRLFATVLRREPDGSHVMVTPVEKLGIDVERTAFRAIEMESEGSGKDRRIALALDSGDALVVGRLNPLKIAQGQHGPEPRVAVRHGLEAELSRPVYYELAEIALSEGEEPPGVWSDGCFFALASE